MSADIKHPYASPQHIGDIFTRLRKTLPPTIDKEYIQRLSIAPKNESSILLLLRFLGLIDDAGKKTETAVDLFHSYDEEFKEKLSNILLKSYKTFFEDHGADGWLLSFDRLAQYFKKTDESPESVGAKKARSFLTLAKLAGKIEPSSSRKPRAQNGAQKLRTTPKNTKNSSAAAAPQAEDSPHLAISNPPAPIHHAPNTSPSSPEVSLTFKIDIHLPPAGDQETYDRIFRSISENLLKHNK